LRHEPPRVFLRHSSRVKFPSTVSFFIFDEPCMGHLA
jgi:hypothetical protein